VRLGFDVRFSNLKKGKRPIKNPYQKPCTVVAGYGFGRKTKIVLTRSGFY